MIQINYSQFAGTVQVMKAVGDHMVLTFCEGLPRSKLFSVVLSRRPGTLTYDVSPKINTHNFPIYNNSVRIHKKKSPGYPRRSISVETKRLVHQISPKSVQKRCHRYDNINLNGPLCIYDHIAVEIMFNKPNKTETKNLCVKAVTAFVKAIWRRKVHPIKIFYEHSFFSVFTYGIFRFGLQLRRGIDVLFNYIIEYMLFNLQVNKIINESHDFTML